MNYEITDREKEILRLIANGHSNKEISIKANISESTVENHIHNIYKKLNIANRAQATAYAFQTGLISSQSKSDKSI